MKPILIFQILIFSINSYCQWENKIPNYSFEKVTSSFPSPSTDGWNTPNCSFLTGAATYDYIEEYWGNVINWTHPLKKDICLECPRVATADLLSSTFLSYPRVPRSGQNWGNTVSTGEYLIVPTLDFFNGGLNPSKTYYIEVFHNGSANDNLDIVGYESQPKICGFESNKPLQDVNANSDHSDVFFSFNASNSSGWTRYRGYFSPNNFKKWLSFGNTGEWDDLRIYEVQNNKCRGDWYFDNTVFNYPVEVFQASNNIYIGNGVDPENGINHIPGDVVQYANTEVILRAGNQVIIDQGSFTQEPGAKLLLIENSPCGDDLCPDELAFENEILCNESSAVIGTEGNDWGTSVQWSPSTYLDNTNIANPTFTSPGGVGAITYQVEVTYTCDASEVKPDPNQPFSFSNTYTVTHEVVVQYTNVTDPTATITADVIQDDAYNFEADLNFSEGVTEFTIEVTSYPGYSQTFYLGEDFSCCNFNWELPHAWRWSSCEDDVVKITAKNKCSGEETIIELPWNKSEVPFSMPSSYPNVVTANNDGSNDQLCFDIESADYFEIVIVNRWGNPIVDYSGPVIQSPLCISAPYGSLPPDTYFYIITFGDDCGNEDENGQFFQIITTKNKSQTSEEGIQSEPNSPKEYLETNIILSPNPTTSTLNISSPVEILSVEIVDKNGRAVMNTEIKNNQVNVETLESGTYYCKIDVNGLIVTKKFVKL